MTQEEAKGSPKTVKCRKTCCDIWFLKDANLEGTDERLKTSLRTFKVYAAPELESERLQISMTTTVAKIETASSSLMMSTP